MSSLRSALRKHLHFIVVVSILLVVMTWPTIVYVFDTETFWLPSDSRDIYMKFWDAWYGAKLMSGAGDFYFTNSLFYPFGVSLVFHNFCVPHMLVFGILKSLFSASSAYNLTYLLIVLANVLSAYVCVLYMLKDRWLALLGAVVFGFHPHVVYHIHQPDVALIATVPLAMFFWQKGYDEQKWSLIAVSGVLVGFTAFIGMYIFVCLLLSLGILVSYLAISNWRKRFLWLSVILLLMLAGTISSIRIFPMLQDSTGLISALDKQRGAASHTDLLSYFINSRHPVSLPAILVEHGVIDPKDFSFLRGYTKHWSYSSFLGYLPILLIAMGFRKRHIRRKMLFWFLLIIPFLILRLGGDLRINDQIVDNIRLPKHYLDTLFPWVFRAFHATDHFMIGVLLPLAIFSCYGLKAVIESTNPRYRSYVVVLCAVWVAFEYRIPPQSRVIHDQELEFIEWLRAQEYPDSIHLINLPMGRRRSKLYGFHQSINGLPHAKGLASRTPNVAYEQYIDRNMILDSWKRSIGIYCTIDNVDSYLYSGAQLLGDGFSHVVYHLREHDAELVADSFIDVPPAYQDEFVTIFLVRDLHDTCAKRVNRFLSQFPHLSDFAHSPQNDSRQYVTLLNLYPIEYDGIGARQYFSNIFEHWGELIHVAYDEQGGATVFNAQNGNTDLSSIIAENKIVWLIYDPQRTDLTGNRVHSEWLLRHFKSCELIFQSEESMVDAYIDRDYPCDLIVAETPLEVRYANGISLANLLAEWDGNQMSIDSWWHRGRYRGYAYTIQLFNEQGEKQLQIDQVIDSRPLSHAQIDTSSLEPGDYVAKLIVYDKDTGQSQKGTILSTQQTVERELEIAEFTVDS